MIHPKSLAIWTPLLSIKAVPPKPTHCDFSSTGSSYTRLVLSNGNKQPSRKLGKIKFLILGKYMFILQSRLNYRVEPLKYIAFSTAFIRTLITNYRQAFLHSVIHPSSTPRLNDWPNKTTPYVIPSLLT